MKKVGAYSKSAQMHLVILVMDGSEISGGVPGYIWKRITASALSQPTLCHEVQGLPARSHSSLCVDMRSCGAKLKTLFPKDQL